MCVGRQSARRAQSIFCVEVSLAHSCLSRFRLGRRCQSPVDFPFARSNKIEHMVPAETAGQFMQPARRSITFVIRATAEPACGQVVDFIAIRSIDFLPLLCDRPEFGKLLFKDLDELGRGAQSILEKHSAMTPSSAWRSDVRLEGAAPLAARRHALTSASAPLTE